MESIKMLSVEAYNYLNEIPSCHWSRHSFSTSSKSGMLLNNCCESFNNVIKDARSKPILTMMEWIRRYVMKRCCVKRDGLKEFEGMIMPSVVKMIDKASGEVCKCDVTQADVYEFEVDHISTGESYVVNLAEKRCGCFRWELMGIPCYHAMACIVKQRLNIEDFVHQAYHVSTYAKTYAPTFHPMPGKHQWPTINLPQPLPPPYRKMPGRPKGSKRIKEKGEGEERVLVIRTKKPNKCGNCGETGHYKNTCKNPQLAPFTSPKSKGGRPRKYPAPSSTTNATTSTSPTTISKAIAPTDTLVIKPTTAVTKRKKSAPSSMVASVIFPHAPLTGCIISLDASAVAATGASRKKSSAQIGIPKPKKHKSMVDVLSSQNNTSCISHVP
ncbi:uncharacterized protein [Spinacia oleracea]|uniref:SWIM-type domain-containing protein n=1 Tax=Spinacia oleracea TaxID=3562 RepID=A0ABM3QPB8_SPIOL|nr:uncharacterized protein LOC110790513 [Spinacia oleracea]XP_056685197.1 uncharacterized protein LOC110790513 [Spinacia oleracea]XP_056685198.1 uncharacterized protein LOC110790513 [Spinacia oleracea]